LSANQNSESPTGQILEFLKRRGSATIKELEELLGITTTAVRQHLNGLQSAGYIARQRVSSGVGRPHHVYSTTPKAHELFACHCDDLALTLLDEVFAAEGEERATWLLERVGNRLAEKYARTVRSEVLQERVEQLAVALQQRGVLTQVDIQDENTFILKAYNCPYHELAHEHRAVCEMDEKLIRQVLKSDVSLTSCMMDGHAGCSFVVTQTNGVGG
jgi:predicted ArsR family transcriptional regulator